MNITKPTSSEYDSFYDRYISLVSDQEDIMSRLKKQREYLVDMYEVMAENQMTFAYEPGKWTIQQVLRHMIDAERIFGYRILCLARGEKKSLPGFSENDYVTQSDDSYNSRQDLITEFIQVRNSNMSMILNLTETQILRQGIVNDSNTSVRAIIYILVGHVAHHIRVLESKYL